MHYVAYLVNGQVVKVPRAYFYSNGFGTSDVEDAVFNETIPPETLNRVVGYGMRQIRNGKYYDEFGVQTRVDPRTGFLYQPYVRGRRPSLKAREELFDTLYQRGMTVDEEIHRGNFKMTEEGPKIFDYGLDYVRKPLFLNDVIHGASRRPVRKLIKRFRDE